MLAVHGTQHWLDGCQKQAPADWLQLNSIYTKLLITQTSTKSPTVHPNGNYSLLHFSTTSDNIHRYFNSKIVLQLSRPSLCCYNQCGNWYISLPPLVLSCRASNRQETAPVTVFLETAAGKGKGAVPNAGHRRGAHLPFLGLWAWWQRHIGVRNLPRVFTP